MRISSASRCGSRSAIIVSTAAAGTINQTARGFSSFFTKSAREEAPMAFSLTNSSTTCWDLSNTTHWWPPRSRRRTIFAPILPRPIMPICIRTPLLSGKLLRLHSVLVEARTQAVHRYSHFAALSKHCCSGDQHIGSRFHDQRRGFRVDTPVNLQITASVALINHPTHSPYFGQRRVDELLMSKSRIDCHDEYLIDITKDFFQHCRGRGWIDDHAGTLAQCLDALHGAMQIGVSFPVNQERIRPGFDKLV